MSEAATTGTEGTSSLLNGGDARAWLPEEYRSDSAFEGIKDLAGLAKSFKDTRAFVGIDKNDLLRLPREGDVPAEVWTRLGRPEKPEGYGLKAVEGIIDDDALGEFATKAHAAGITGKHATEMFNLYVGMVQAGQARKQAEAVEAAKTGEAELRREWGATYDDKIHAMKRAIDRFGGDGLKQAFDQAGLGGNPLVVKMFAQMGEMLGEGGLKGGGQGGMGTALSPDAARAEIATLQSDQAFVRKYLDASAEGHREAKEKMRALFAAANPGMSTTAEHG